MLHVANHFKLYKKTYLALLGIVLLAFILRAWGLGNNSFVADEFLDINATYGYAMTGEWQAWDFNLGEPAQRINEASDSRAWLYRWQVARLFEFLPPTEAVARSVSVFWGVITTLLIFFTASLWTGKRAIGLISAFLFAVSLFGIEYDRTLRMYAMFFPMFLLFSWTLYQGLERRPQGFHLPYLVLAGALGLLSLHLHTLTLNMAFIVGVYLAVMAIREWHYGRGWKNKYMGLLGAGMLGGTVFLAVTGGEIAYLGGLKFFEDHYRYIALAVTDYAHPLFALSFGVLGTIGLYRSGKRQKESIWLAVSYLTILCMAVFVWNRVVGMQYIFFAQSFLMILIASGIYFTAAFFQKNLKEYGERAFWVTIILVLLFVPKYAYFFEENTTYRQNSQGDEPRYRNIFHYFKKHRSENDALITRDFRNYYFSGEKVIVYDFGGERSKDNFTLSELEDIMARHPSGWIIYSDNDESYLSKESQQYIETYFERVNDIQVRGKVYVYRW